MKLTKKNLQEWKAALDKAMLPYYPENEKYSECLEDAEWLDFYEDYTVEEAVSDELNSDY
jgi:hypothetical protein